MKDERIKKEMNLVKSYVLLYVFIAAVILGVLKLIIFGFNLSYFYVEGFLIISTMILFSIVSLYHLGKYDERIEEKVDRIYHRGFILIFVGSLWLHFYQVISNIIAQTTIISITNTLILVGFIVALVLLKKRGLYANYKSIEHSKPKYYLSVLFNIFLLFVLFEVIYHTVVFALSVNLNISIYPPDLFAILAISFVVISLEYSLFSIYEKNHYDEMIAFEKEKPNILSKNAFSLQMIVYTFALISGYINLRLIMITSGNLSDQRFGLQRWLTFQTYTKIVALDFAIFGLIVSLIIYYYLVKLIGIHKMLTFYLILSIISFAFAVFGYIFSLMLPYLQSIFNSQEAFIRLVTAYSQINLGISVIFSLIYMTLGLYLYLKKVPYRSLFLIYSVLSLLTNNAISGLLIKGDISTLFLVRFIASTLLSTYTLFLIGFLAYHRYQLITHHKVINIDDTIVEVY